MGDRTGKRCRCLGLYDEGGSVLDAQEGNLFLGHTGSILASVVMPKGRALAAGLDAPELWRMSWCTAFEAATCAPYLEALWSTHFIELCSAAWKIDTFPSCGSHCRGHARVSHLIQVRDFACPVMRLGAVLPIGFAHSKQVVLPHLARRVLRRCLDSIGGAV